MVKKDRLIEGETDGTFDIISDRDPRGMTEGPFDGKNDGFVVVRYI